MIKDEYPDKEDEILKAIEAIDIEDILSYNIKD